jgi:hypothetical protein
VALFKQFDYQERTYFRSLPFTKSSTIVIIPPNDGIFFFLGNDHLYIIYLFLFLYQDSDIAFRTSYKIYLLG